MNSIAKFAIKIIVSAFILLALIVIGGVGYIWYTGKNSPDIPDVEVAKTNKLIVDTKPNKPPEDAIVGASVQSLTTPVKPGTNTSLTVKTTPESKCTITMIYGKVASTDSGLVPKTADEYGVVTWTWTVESNVPVGKYPVKILCTRGKKSGATSGMLEISNKIEE